VCVVFAAADVQEQVQTPRDCGSRVVFGTRQWQRRSNVAVRADGEAAIALSTAVSRTSKPVQPLGALPQEQMGLAL
jgi:hypothetical protein